MAMATTIRIPELPNEIVHSIIDQMRPPDLKNVRLASKLFAMMSEPRLFYRMNIVPYTDCLESFSQLMERNPIAQHVHTLCYDAQYRYTVDFVPETSSENGETVKKKLRDNGLWCMGEGSLETLLLVQCLRSLPMLVQVLVTEFVIPPVRQSSYQLQDLPSYFHRIANGTDIRSFRRTEGRPPEIYPSAKLALLACCSAGVKLAHFQAAEVDHRFFLEPGDRHGRLKELSVYKIIFGELKQLDLGFRGSYDGPPNVHANFGSLISATKKVEQLRLSMPDANVNTWTEFEPKDSWLSRLVRHQNGKLRTKPTFPNLTHLTLSCMVCQEAELVALIRNHRHTLKHVSLHQMTLIKGLEQDSPPCWVQALKEIRSCRVAVTLGGNLTNSHRQWWRVVTEPQTGRKSPLKAQVEKWASGKGRDICPIEQAAVKVGADNKEIVPSREDFFRGDGSWIMWRRCHESLEEEFDEDDEEDEDDDSSFWSDDTSGYSDDSGGLDLPEWFEDYLDELTGSEYDTALETALEHLQHDF